MMVAGRTAGVMRVVRGPFRRSRSPGPDVGRAAASTNPLRQTCPLSSGDARTSLSGIGTGRFVRRVIGGRAVERTRWCGRRRQPDSPHPRDSVTDGLAAFIVSRSSAALDRPSIRSPDEARRFIRRPAGRVRADGGGRRAAPAGSAATRSTVRMIFVDRGPLAEKHPRASADCGSDNQRTRTGRSRRWAGVRGGRSLGTWDADEHNAATGAEGVVSGGVRVVNMQTFIRASRLKRDDLDRRSGSVRSPTLGLTSNRAGPAAPGLITSVPVSSFTSARCV